MSRKHWLVLALTAVILIAPTTAFAHAELDKSDPAANSTVASVPAQTTLSFTEAPAVDSPIRVLDGCKKNVNSGQTVNGKAIAVTLSDSAQPGLWNVVWKSISADDGHVEHGQYSFTVSGKADCSNDKGSGAALNPDKGSSFPWVPVIIGLVVLIALALFVRSRTASG
ncbi:MAG: copper resistance protein CopC [Actinomycetota bacterium]